MLWPPLLALKVHWDGFYHDPRRYAEGIWWRLTGKKLRARHRFSELCGQSTSAYDLWMARREPALLAALTGCGPVAMPPILVAIIGPGDDAAVAATLASVRAASATVPVLLPGQSAQASGWVLVLRAGDLIARAALDAYRAAATENPLAAAIYADDDLVDDRSHRHAPHFKPDWNPELLRHHDYLGHSALLPWQGPFEAVDRDWRGLVAASCAQAASQPVHLPLVLHHRRARPEPCVPEPTPCAVGDRWPSVTILVPTRDRVELLRTCLEGLARTDYPDFDCIVIDNDSRDRETLAYLEGLSGPRHSVMRFGGPFNYSAMNNAAAKQARGELLCFLNNDIEIPDAGWLRHLVAATLVLGSGAVGGKLLYPDGTIQHAGVVIGIGGGAGHAHRYLGNDEPGYFSRAHLPQQVSAVTAACLVVERRKFEAVGGFDEFNFPVAFNDVDLCLKLGEQGWPSFYEPRAVLVHHESKSRGSDSAAANRERFGGELAALKRIWGTDIRRDPYHHPQLSPFCDNFVVAI